jgi:acetyl-CoA carboxylase carboxyl transferase subunit alpha
MQQFSTYSVISPEGCAAILWRDKAFAPDAAEALKPTAKDLLELKLIDAIIPEPSDGAHRNVEAAAELIAEVLEKALDELLALPQEQLLAERQQRLRHIGEFS